LEYENIIDLIIDNIKKLIFPEEWLKIDMTLSKQEIFTLMLLDREGEIIMSRIADYVNVSMSTATGIVERLVKNGYLVRNRNDNDRRIVIIKLTDKAKSIVSQIKTIGLDYYGVIMEALTDEERRFLSSILVKIIAAINNRNTLPMRENDHGNRITKIEIE
jgi:MarR family transcriptional regulator, organic hydroperoxide resistance regulator